MTKTSEKLTKQILLTYWRHAWRHKGYAIALIATVPFASLALRFLPPLFVADILSKIERGDFVEGNLWESFGSELVAYAGVSILGGIILWRVAIFCVWQLEMRVIQDIHRRIFNHLMSQSPSFHANRFAGSLVSQTSKFASSYIRLADTIVFDLFTLVLSFAFTIIILAPRAPHVVAVILLFSILFMYISVKITARIRELRAVEASKSNRQTGFLADAVTNVLAVKSFSAGGYENKRYAQATQDTRDAERDIMVASIKREIFFSSVTIGLGIITLVIAAASVVNAGADIATVFLVVTYTGVIAQNLWEFTQHTLRNINRALGDAKDMTQILSIEPTIKDPAEPEPSRISEGGIVIRSLDFAHADSNDDDSLFADLNLTIAPGEKIGLVGHSGSGKTTLTKLLLRFHDIDGGEILIDGQNIAHITQDDLRVAMAYVPQEPLLFHRSIRENISYGKPDATDDEIYDAAKRANAHEFIQTLPAGYETLVGERGVKLSGGQRQRVAIARALIKDAPILLLDEATSALDSESEILIQDALWTLMKGRTAIVIAHRLSTIQRMDRIVVLDKGKIIEQGSHKELLAHNGAYAKLWAHQSGGFIEE